MADSCGDQESRGVPVMKTYRRDMKFRNPKSEIRNLRRRAFTLVELMVVIVIIGVLMSLILPAISRARRAAQEAKVMTEINGLASAISGFKAKYGVEPPSSISIYLTSGGWNGDPTSRGIIRSIWPQFDFTMGDPMGGTAGAGTAFPSYWTTSATNNAINLYSGECLLFFLGGVQTAAFQPPAGFAKNPLYPFAPVSQNANREGPFYEFSNISQLSDIDGNGFNEWKDTLPAQTNPYLYYSSYEGRGYNVGELANTGGNYVLLHDVYRVSSAAGTTPPANVAAAGTGSQTLPAQKPQTFQIISPGYDANYGQGGVFNPNLTNSGLTDSSGNPDTAAYDNLTNFNGGRLNP